MRDAHYLCFLTLNRVQETERTWAEMMRPERWGPHMDHVKTIWYDNGSKRKDLEEIKSLYATHEAFFLSETNKGIAKGINEMMHYAFMVRGAKFVTTMGSDIIEPPMFVDIRETVFRMHPEIGICATPPQNDKPVYAYDDYLQMDVGQPIGNHTYSRELWEAIGYLREDYGIYGPLDLDYCDRAKAAGFLSVQITNWPSWHIGVNNPPDYEAAKQASLKVSWKQYLNNRKAYINGKDIRYVPERFQ